VFAVAISFLQPLHLKYRTSLRLIFVATLGNRVIPFFGLVSINVRAQ
jgi:hypothetical protein